MKVIMLQNPMTGSLEIGFFVEINGKRCMAKAVDLVWNPDDNDNANTRTEPTLTLPSWAADGFLKSMAECLDSMGVKTENDHKIQGVLEATRKHLDDMRRLVFKGEEV